MPTPKITRRSALQLIGASAGAAAAEKAIPSPVKAVLPVTHSYVLCLNMATIRGHKLGFVKELETAAAAGFRSVEIWADSLQEYLIHGGTIGEAKKRLDDLGLKVEDLISFNKWVADDAATRKDGLEQMKRDMEQMAILGCKRIAATGMGSSNAPVPGLDVIAQRYRTVLEMGDQTGVVPQLEMWGFQKNMSNVAEVIYIAMKSGHPSARVLLDIFHLYKGGTSINTLPLMDANAAEILHMNDYPATLSSAIIEDKDRIYPGDGVAPIEQILQILLKNRKKPLVLSTEVFNAAYYTQDALTVAKTAMEKMKRVVDNR
ncbi:sugar phosphate isomerase/epimerase family protein [Mucilaginibacter gotjawali]|uniref:Sugar phosphate isomerase/epimerase n=2 Tax=Mucilaginibacter gotjawali TaxID=1550579 RepID=A0A839SEC2_9SPHI|nr:sugar phosphate isomerase/epimerase family protein [Mucilaginibacter gotjawali]MBB3056136.1 sugar phosphate isomerase/epimerase [Mucilaginibacter gotjawali]BAU53524.1 Xylose isomerase-like TIM barrel [Mucilaginibacter gotjawali]